jgi:hypothetical protein
MEYINITKEMAGYFVYDERSKSCLRIKSNNKEVGSIDLDSRKSRYKRWRVSLPNCGLLLAHRVVWVLFNGEIPEGFEIDHKDGDALNNKISNLRLADRKIATKNLGMRSDNKTGTTGVSYKKNSRSGLEMYVARWKEGGRDRSKAFSFNRHGKENAFKLACTFRANVIQRLVSEGYSYTERHGTQGDYETSPEVAEEVGQMLVDGIKKAGTMLKMQVPLDGEYKVGNNAAEIH